MTRFVAALVLWHCLISAQPSLIQAQPADAFLVKPYFQLGNTSGFSKPGSLVLIWHSSEGHQNYSVDVRGREETWRKMPAPVSQLVGVRTMPKHYVWRVTLSGLAPGEEFRYRVTENAKPVFEATGRARKSPGQPVRFALFGDLNEQPPAQRAIAYQTWLQRPDFLFITGDVVYEDGRLSEYRTQFYPVYNCDEASAQTGAPLIRSIPFMAAPGNHDTALRSFRHFPDALAYFIYWDLPLNGPPNPQLRLIGNSAAQPAFLAAAENRWPVMASYSFDYGDSHWTVLDSNPYMDWTQPALRKWLEDDLAAARPALWRFVAFHDSAFSSAKEHFKEQRMRLLAPVFEKGKVDLIFSGHVHNYQRSFPLRFAPARQADGRAKWRKGQPLGELIVDRNFHDGATAGPIGIIYIISGAGGSSLYNPEQMKKPKGWQPFTDKFIADVHSFTLVDIAGRTLELKQISETGKVVDAFRIVK